MPQWYGASASAPPMSFIRKGTPRKGPSGSSGELAAARARSGAAWITALSWGFTRSRRASAASTSSRGETAPRRTSAACSVASRAERSSTMSSCSTDIHACAAQARGTPTAAHTIQPAKPTKSGMVRLSSRRSGTISKRAAASARSSEAPATVA